MDINNTVKVLIIVAHTDDETLGMGGSIARHSKNGEDVYAMSMTNGVGSRDSINKLDIDKRSKASIEASKVLGFKWLDSLSYPDNKLDSVPLLDIVKNLENVKSVLNPDLIYTHTSADLNIDHRMVNQAVLTAFRPQPNENWSEIRTFEVPSSTDYGHSSVTNSYEPNLFIDISDFWELKLKAMEKYSDEMREYPHSRSYHAIENLAKCRGNQNGLRYAESFQVLKRILR